MKTLISFITIALLAFIMWLSYNATETNQYDKYASSLGTLFTIIGFGITLYQIVIVKEQNKIIKIETENAAKRASEKIKTVLNISDISDTINKLQIIQHNLTNNKIELALYQMQEINKILLEIQNDESYRNVTRFNFRSKMSAYSSDISSLQDIVSNQQTKPNICLSPIIKDIHQIEENIILVRNYLKQKAYE